MVEGVELALRPITAEPTDRLPDVTATARSYAEASKIDAAWNTYRADWNEFISWCQRSHGGSSP